MKHEEPKYWGYVVKTLPHPRDQNQVLWRVKVQTLGLYYGQIATVDQDNVPAGIGVGRDLKFDLVTAGKKAGLVAVNAALYVRPRVVETAEKETR